MNIATRLILPMVLATACSGIGSPELAATSLGWKCAWSSEIDPFACAVLKARFPNTPNLGDMTKLHGGDLERADVIFAGTPCQSFSVAGLREGMDDPRGNLALIFLRLVDQLRPRWVVWENVPGVLSSSDGRDFGCFLGGLGQLGYGFAYRVLDAQFVRVHGHEHAVPQRRRRVFVVGYLGDWRRAAAVLFERNCLSGNPAPIRETGKGFAREVAASLRSSGAGTSRVGDTRGQDNVVCAAVSPALKSRDYKGPSSDGDGDGAPLIPVVSHALKADGFDASEDGTGRGTPIIPAIGFTIHGTDKTAKVASETDVCGSLRTKPPGSIENSSTTVIAGFKRGQGSSARSDGYQIEQCPTLTAADSGTQNPPGVQIGMSVRRLTPIECERLQGFPDDFTNVTHRKKTAADGPRYKAIGNSIAVNCSRWILERIQMVDSIGRAA